MESAGWPLVLQASPWGVLQCGFLGPANWTVKKGKEGATDSSRLAGDIPSFGAEGPSL